MGRIAATACHRPASPNERVLFESGGDARTLAEGRVLQLIDVGNKGMAGRKRLDARVGMAGAQQGHPRPLRTRDRVHRESRHFAEKLLQRELVAHQGRQASQARSAAWAVASSLAASCSSPAEIPGCQRRLVIRRIRQVALHRQSNRRVLMAPTGAELPSRPAPVRKEALGDRKVTSLPGGHRVRQELAPERLDSQPARLTPPAERRP